MKTCLTLLLIVVVAGCDNDDTETCAVGCCPTPETVEHFPWVMELIDNLGECGACDAGVVSGTYGSRTVVFTKMNDPLCNGIFIGPLYDCRGKMVEYISFSDRDQQRFRELLVSITMLRQCKDLSDAPFDLGG
jgi:hypothetical protein